MNKRQFINTAASTILAMSVSSIVSASAADDQVQSRDDNAYPGTKTFNSRYMYDTLVQRLELAITNNNMVLVAKASASEAAAVRGVIIPGNIVLMVFRNDFAVLMLQASIPAGIEAPLRIYVTENENGTGSVTYRIPTATFAPYQNSQLNVLARELDPIFFKIVSDTIAEVT